MPPDSPRHWYFYKAPSHPYCSTLCYVPPWTTPWDKVALSNQYLSKGPTSIIIPFLHVSLHCNVCQCNCNSGILPWGGSLGLTLKWVFWSPQCFQWVRPPPTHCHNDYTCAIKHILWLDSFPGSSQPWGGAWERGYLVIQLLIITYFRFPSVGSNSLSTSRSENVEPQLEQM